LCARRNDGRIKVDELTVVGAVPLSQTDTVWIMADVTGGFHPLDVLFMFLETVVPKDTVTAMTLITEGIDGTAFFGIIRGHVLPFENRGEDRSVRTIGTGTAGLGPRIVVMAVTTGNDTGGGKRRDETWHVRIHSRPHHRMKRGISGVELQTDVSLSELPGGPRSGFVGAVGMATEADLVLKGNRTHLGSGGVHAPDATEGPGRRSRPRPGGMRVVTVDALHVPRG
jgi:hypothetical protein